MRKWILTISIGLNIIFIIGWGLYSLNKYLHPEPSYKLGRLEKDIRIGSFMGDSILFTMPKGLTVRNASQRGLNAIGQFENERFQIVISSNDRKLINYDLPSDSLAPNGNYYSADCDKWNNKEE